jgi:hypothetical protein
MTIILRLSSLIASLSVLAACTTSPAVHQIEPEKLLVGCWSGYDYQPVFGQSALWQMHRRVDGTFKIEFRSPILPVQIETGKWKVVENTYTTLTLAVNGNPVDVTDPQFTDKYVLKELTPTSITYFHAGANQTFRSNKIACPGDA